ncbi:hypothetical protein HUJ05_011142 [Dendroctonus ponderosae]|nr:hypothetical protein HUJ05_011142 [Dendroctonus ponderosae]
MQMVALFVGAVPLHGLDEEGARPDPHVAQLQGAWPVSAAETGGGSSYSPDRRSPRTSMSFTSRVTSRRSITACGCRKSLLGHNSRWRSWSSNWTPASTAKGDWPAGWEWGRYHSAGPRGRRARACVAS